MRGVPWSGIIVLFMLASVPHVEMDWAEIVRHFVLVGMAFYAGRLYEERKNA